MFVCHWIVWRLVENDIIFKNCVQYDLNSAYLFFLGSSSFRRGEMNLCQLILKLQQRKTVGLRLQKKLFIQNVDIRINS